MTKNKRKILVVDDEASLVQLCKLILEQAGYKVQSAFSGRQALSRVEEEMPDIIVLDVMMPGMTGIDVCRTIRRGDFDKRPFIIMYTADDRDVTRDSCLDAGADKFVTKSVSPFDLPKQFEGELVAE